MSSMRCGAWWSLPEPVATGGLFAELRGEDGAPEATEPVEQEARPPDAGSRRPERKQEPSGARGTGTRTDRSSVQISVDSPSV